MRRTTITILAVTLSASASACGGASETVSRPNQQQLAGEPAENTTSSSDKETSPSEPASTPAPEPKPGATEDPKPEPAACDMIKLRDELAAMTLETAVSQHEHFRCLCDDQGYPLVGNINSKGTTPSAVCTTLKEKGLL
jgi:hypothetical protein